MGDPDTDSLAITLISERTLFRTLLADCLRRIKATAIVSEFSSPDEWLSASPSSSDVLIIDLVNGAVSLEALSAIRGDVRSGRILVLGNAEGDWWPEAAFRAGARALVHEHDVMSEFLAGLHATASGRIFQSVVSLRSRNIFHVAAKLTRRESEVLMLACRGVTDAGVGQILGISSATAETYRTSILRKLDLPDTAALQIFGIRIGVSSAKCIDVRCRWRRSAGGDRRKKPQPLPETLPLPLS